MSRSLRMAIAIMVMVATQNSAAVASRPSAAQQKSAHVEKSRQHGASAASCTSKPGTPFTAKAPAAVKHRIASLFDGAAGALRSGAKAPVAR
ncbi:MAG: hypothetical protein AB7N80_05825 [Bdellovibrionales bacterium]